MNEDSAPQNEIARRVTDTVRNGANVEVVYGTPVVQGDHTIIPVARVSYGFGFGGGSGSGPDGAEVGSGIGGGGGGGVSAVPVAVIEIGPDGTHIRPIYDVNSLLRLVLVIAGMLLIARTLRGVVRRRG
ncbi:MAG: hypothetical protein QOF51_1762 [Chloroflexota bacterium]|jgi:uncharacterized spore protein YtfJ|nr:hypothetical protein [Chloroflexota bacterium]